MTRLLGPDQVPSIDRMPRLPEGTFAPCTCIEQLAVATERAALDVDGVCPTCQAWTCDLDHLPWRELKQAVEELRADAEAAGVSANYYHDGVIPPIDDGEDSMVDVALNNAHHAAWERLYPERNPNAPTPWDGKYTSAHYRCRIAAMRRTLTARSHDWTAPMRKAAPLTAAEYRRRLAVWVSPAQMLALPAVPWALYPGGDWRAPQDRARDVIAGVLSTAVSDGVASVLGAICEARVDTWMVLRDLIASSARVHLIYSSVGHKQDHNMGVILFEDKPMLAFDIGECSDSFCRVGILDAELWRNNLLTAAHAARLDHVLPTELLPPRTRDPKRPVDPADEPYLTVDTRFVVRPELAEEA